MDSNSEAPPKPRVRRPPPNAPSPAAPATHLDDAIEGLTRQLHATGARPPKPHAPPALAAPNLAQVGLALGAGLLRPRFALGAATMPLQAGLQRHADDVAATNAGNAARQAAWRGHVQALQGELGAAERERAIAARGGSSGGGQGGRSGAPISPTITLDMTTPDLRAQIARTIEGDPRLADAVRTYHATSAADRASLRARYVKGKKLPLFGTLHDDVLDHYGALEPDEIHAAAYPNDSPATAATANAPTASPLFRDPRGRTGRTLVTDVLNDAHDHLQRHPENRPQVVARLRDLGIPLD